MPNEDKAVTEAQQAAHQYLRYKLGGRRGCRVLDHLDEELQQELIDECAKAFEDYAKPKLALADALRDAAEEVGKQYSKYAMMTEGVVPKSYKSLQRALAAYDAAGKEGK